MGTSVNHSVFYNTRKWARPRNRVQPHRSVRVLMEVVDSHFHLWTVQTHPWIVKVKDGGHPGGKFGN